MADSIFANDVNLRGQEYEECVSFFSGLLPDSFSFAELVTTLENECEILYRNHGRRKGLLYGKELIMYLYFLSVLHAEAGMHLQKAQREGNEKHLH